MQELDQFKTKMLTWAKKLAQDLTALNKKIKAARPVVSAAPLGVVPGEYEGQILINKAPIGMKYYCWADRKWNEIGSKTTIEELEQQLSIFINTNYIKAIPRNEDNRPPAQQLGYNSILINKELKTIEIAYPQTGEYKLANSPIPQNGIPTQVPISGIGTMIQDTGTKKIYMWNGASWIELGGGGGAAGNYVTREEFNNALKKIQEEVSKIRG